MKEKLCFQIKTSLSITRHYIKLNIILIFSLAAGLLLPMLCIGNINTFISRIPTMKINNAESSLILYCQGTIFSREEVVSYFKSKSFSIQEISIVTSEPVIISWEGQGTKSNVFYAGKDLLTFEKFKLLSGHMDIFQNHDDLCIIESAFIDRHGDLKVGNSISIGSKIYTIAGIFSSFNYYGRIIVPFSESHERNLKLSLIYLKVPDIDTNKYKFSLDTVSAGFTVTKVLDGVSAYQRTLKSGVETSSFIMLIGFMSLGLAAINISLVLTGKLMQIKRIIGIRMALGATKGSILANVIIENTFFYLFAFFIDIVIAQLLIYFSPKEVVFEMNIVVYFMAFLLGFLVLLGISLLSVNILFRKKLMEIIERR